MEHFGNTILHLAAVTSFYAFIFSFLGGKKNLPAVIRHGHRAAWVTVGLTWLTTLSLVSCILQDKFSVRFVAEYSSQTLPFVYKVAALWGGQNGSLLFWVAVLTAFTGVVLYRQRNRNPELMPYVTGILMLISTFFLILLVFAANPFQTLSFTPADGRGLNPLLQNFYMLIHPPTLYLGFVGMSIPFAFAMAALLSGRLDSQWVYQVRRWTLVAWFFLTIGNLLGALWAYEVLGWGGYWGWDPVENTSFLPWLTATAFLHSILVQEKRNILKAWNMTLVVLSFLLTLCGTFLTRSGIVSSVHSFGQSTVGWYFLAFLLFLLVISVALLIYRRKGLRGSTAFDSFVSREAAALLNNLVLVGATLVILWGTLFPVFSEWLRGTRVEVGPPYFNSLMIPIGLLLLFLTGIGPFVNWQTTPKSDLKRSFRWPLISGALALLATLFFVSTKPYVVASLSICTFVLATIVFDFVRGVRKQKRNPFEAFLQLFIDHPRRYGAHIVHLGIVFLFIGFTGEAFKKEAELSIAPRETVSFGDYAIQFHDLLPESDHRKERVIAKLFVWKNGKRYAVMHPAKSSFRSGIPGEPAQQVTDVAIKRSLKEDLYFAFLALEDDNTLILQGFINPLVQFVWIGGLLLVLGTVIVIWPRRESIA